MSAMPVIDVETLWWAKVVVPVDAGGEHHVGHRPGALLRRAGTSTGLGDR
jgi:hypothetical protein